MIAIPTFIWNDWFHQWNNKCMDDTLGIFNCKTVVDNISQKLYERSWQEAVQAVSGSKQDFLPEAWKNHKNNRGITKVAGRLAADQISDQQWAEYEMHSSTLRIKDLEMLVGDPIGSEAGSVWTSICSMNSTLSDTKKDHNTQLAVKYDALELEMDNLLGGMKVFRDKFVLEI